MTTQYDFTTAEWDQVATAPVLVGLAVAKIEDSGFFGSMREMRTLGATLTDSVPDESPARSLIASAAGQDTESHMNAFKATAPDALADAAVTACKELMLLLGRIATPEEATAYARWVHALGAQVAEAAKEGGVRVSPGEVSLLKRIEEALVLT